MNAPLLLILNLVTFRKSKFEVILAAFSWFSGCYATAKSVIFRPLATRNMTVLAVELLLSVTVRRRIGDSAASVTTSVM